VKLSIKGTSAEIGALIRSSWWKELETLGVVMSPNIIDDKHITPVFSAIQNVNETSFFEEEKVFFENTEKRYIDKLYSLVEDNPVLKKLFAEKLGEFIRTEETFFSTIT
jgi:hypothetical protein